MSDPHPNYGPCDGFGPDGSCSECTGTLIRTGPCMPVPDEAVTKSIGLIQCSECGHGSDCWLNYLRWEVDRDVTLNKHWHHLVAPNIAPPLQISPEQYTEALDYLRRLVQYLTKHGGYMSTKYQAALRGARALLKEQGGA